MNKTAKVVLISIATVVATGMLLMFGLVGLVVAASAVQPQNQVAQSAGSSQEERDDRALSQAHESLENLGGSNVDYGN